MLAKVQQAKGTMRERFGAQRQWKKKNFPSLPANGIVVSVAAAALSLCVTIKICYVAIRATKHP
jgi:hypothetical protein